MNYFTLIPLFAFIASCFTCSVIIGRDLRKAEHKSFLLFSLAIQAWAASDFLNWMLGNNDLTLFLLRIKSIAWLSAGPLFLHFIYTFIRRKRDLVFNIVAMISLA